MMIPKKRKRLCAIFVFVLIVARCQVSIIQHSVSTQEDDTHAFTIPTTSKVSPSPPQSIGPCHNLVWENSSSKVHKTKPIWVASFPGSGAEMFRQLIGHVTGGKPAWSTYIKDNPVPNTTCLEANQAATCKTHWPVLLFQPIDFENFHSKAIILLRNPISAFPSRFNHQWELQHKVGYHVQQAPERAWNSWIKRSFQDQQDKFIEFITTWANLSHNSRVALFVPYEGLTDPHHGPMWTSKIIQVLHNAGIQHVSHGGNTDIIECLWKDAILDRPQRKRAPHTYKPGYTPTQQQFFQTLFQEIFSKFTHNSDNYDNNNNDKANILISNLRSIMKTYEQTIYNNHSIRII